MSEPTWVRVAVCDDIPAREGRAVRLGDRDLALFNLGDRFLATDNRCPHRGGPLCDGIVTGTSVVCPLHGWKVNLESGVVERPASEKACAIVTYPTRVEDGVVSVEIPEGTAVTEGTEGTEVAGSARRTGRILSDASNPSLHDASHT